MPVCIRQAIRIVKITIPLRIKMTIYFILMSYIKQDEYRASQLNLEIFLSKKIPTFSDRDSWFVYFVGSIAIKALRGVV